MMAQTRSKGPGILRRVRPYMGNRKIFLPLSLLCSALSAVASLLPFIFIWRLIHRLLNLPAGAPLPWTEIRSYALWATLALVAGLLLYFLALLCSHVMAFRVEMNMQKVGFRKLLAMPLGFFSHRESGSLRKVIVEGAAETHSFLAHQLPDLAGGILSPLIVLVLLFTFDWRMGLASLVPLLMGMMLLSIMMSPKGQEFQKKYYEKLDEMSAEAVEYVRCIPVVKTFGQTVTAFTRFYDSILSYRDGVYAYTIMWRRPMSAYTVVVESAAFLLVPLAIFLIGRGEQPAAVLSDFILYLLLAPLFGSMFMKLAYWSNNKNVCLQALDRYDRTLNFPLLPEVPADQAQVPTSFDLEWSDVSFRYEADRPLVLEHFNLKVAAGETVALVGASGSGKSTVARLLARFWDVNEGAVKIGGVDVRHIPKEKLMESIAFVFQNAGLMPGSLRDNVCFGRDAVSTAELQRALEGSRAAEIIAEQSDGLDTQYGSGGTWLSGGEQQRIALARAFLKDAPIVLLDEATAFADPENEQAITAALKELGRGKTCLLIAHRLSTVRDCDRIVVMDGGRIVEMGSHSELLAQGGRYKAMLESYEAATAWTLSTGKEA